MSQLLMDEVLAELKGRGFRNSDEAPLKYAQQWSQAELGELVNVKKDTGYCPLVIHPRHSAKLAALEAIQGVVVGKRPYRKSSQFKGFPREHNDRTTPSFFGIDFGFVSHDALSRFLNVLLGQEALEIDQDLAEIRGSARAKTTAERLVEARLGQGKYRNDLFGIWGACSVTGCSNGILLRASHIKPWRGSSDHERLDPQNGLLLVAGLDAAFDKGLISFDGNGKLLIGSGLSSADGVAIGVQADMALRKPMSECTKLHMAHHRQIHGFEQGGDP